MQKIAIDMMGGDYAPQEAVKGIAQFLSQSRSEQLLQLIGDKTILTELLTEAGVQKDAVEIIQTTEVIEMHEHPTKALKQKPDSSIAIGFKMLASGESDAFISAGNTGAMMVGALFSIKTLSGVLRPTIGAYIPRENGTLGLLVDVGLNADCKPENLNQFATMGSLFAKHILQIKEPKTALLNLGQEEGKGNILTQAAYPILKENKNLDFIGNVEGRDILLSTADVITCEGFTGNVVLKMAESMYDISKRRELKDSYFEQFNFEIYGGVPVLGVAKPIIIGHGISGSTAFVNMIKTASKMLGEDLCGKIEEAFS